MTEKQRSHDEPVPRMQQLFDRPFVLLVAGLVVMFAFYTLWGAAELVLMPQATLP